MNENLDIKRLLSDLQKAGLTDFAGCGCATCEMLSLFERDTTNAGNRADEETRKRQEERERDLTMLGDD